MQTLITTPNLAKRGSDDANERSSPCAQTPSPTRVMEYAAGDAAWTKNVTPMFLLKSVTSFVGATIVVNVAVDNPRAIPLQFKLFAFASAPTNAWSELAAPSTQTFPVSQGFGRFEYPVVDSPPFCAAGVLQYGVQVQPSATVLPSNAGVVTIYFQSFAVVGPAENSGAGGTSGGPNGGAAGQSSGDSGGSNAGAAGASGAGGAAGGSNAGAAGSVGTTGSGAAVGAASATSAAGTAGAG